MIYQCFLYDDSYCIINIALTVNNFIIINIAIIIVTNAIALHNLACATLPA